MAFYVYMESCQEVTMGAWGVGITSNDAAQDLKKEFQAAFSYYDVETALGKIDEYVRADGYAESDESDWCDYYYSLANFMWKKGILTNKVRFENLFTFTFGNAS